MMRFQFLPSPLAFVGNSSSFESFECSKSDCFRFLLSLACAFSSVSLVFVGSFAGELIVIAGDLTIGTLYCPADQVDRCVPLFVTAHARLEITQFFTPRVRVRRIHVEKDIQSSSRHCDNCNKYLHVIVISTYTSCTVIPCRCSVALPANFNVR
jgi:hypothetical protein